MWSGQGVCVCGRGGKWIRLVRCGACDSDGDKGRVPKWWDHWAYDEENSVSSKTSGIFLLLFDDCLEIVVMIAHFCYQSCRLGLVTLHPVFLFFIGSARRKLTCTICNRKCSSSLNLQEHRKVRLYNIYCTAQIIPTRYFALDLRGFTQLMQFCMIHFYSDVSLLLFPSRSTVSITQSNLLISHPSLLPELLS